MERKSPVRLAGWVLFGGIVAVTVLVVTVILPADPRSDDVPPDRALALFESLAGTPLPPGTRAVDATATTRKDSYVLLDLRLPRSAVEGWAATAGLDGPDRARESVDRLARDARSGLGTPVTLDGGHEVYRRDDPGAGQVELLVLPDSGETVRVVAVAFET